MTAEINGAEAANKENPGVPIRMCVICHRRFAKSELGRHVLDSNGLLAFDASGHQRGRGWYRCLDPDCIKRFSSYRPRIKAGKNGKASGR